jgi:hypothetical protein
VKNILTVTGGRGRESKQVKQTNKKGKEIKIENAQYPVTE